MIQKFRKKPVVIEAVQYDGKNRGEIYKFTDGKAVCKDEISKNGVVIHLALTIDTLEGKMIGLPYDWIIKGVNGEFYPYKPDIFEKTYEPA